MSRRLRDQNPDLDPPGFLQKEYDVVSAKAGWLPCFFYPSSILMSSLWSLSTRQSSPPLSLSTQPVTGQNRATLNVNVEAYHARAWEITKAQGPALFQTGLSMYMMVSNQVRLDLFPPLLIGCSTEIK